MAGSPPSADLVIFNGQNLPHWQYTQWRIICGRVAGTNNPTSRKSLGDGQIQLEWMLPDTCNGSRYDRGNIGVL